MPATARFPALPYFFASILGLLALVGYWYGLGRPVVLPDVASASHKLQCASYTPFDKDQSPFDQPFTLRPERMDADLALLATRFECIRTYSMTGLEALPDLARKHARTQSSIRLRLEKLGKLPPSGEARYESRPIAASA